MLKLWKRPTKFFKKPWLGTVREIKDRSSSLAIRCRGQISCRITRGGVTLGMGRTCISDELQVSLTPVLSAASGLVPVPPAQHTHTQSKGWKMHDQVYGKAPTKDQSCRSQQHSLAPASFTCCLLEFSNMGKDIKSLERGKAHLQGTPP